MMFFGDPAAQRKSSAHSLPSFGGATLQSPRLSADYMDMSLLTHSPRARALSASSNALLRRDSTPGTSSNDDQLAASQRAAEEQDHRKRFLSDAERLLADHPREAKLSFAQLESNDPKLWQSTPAAALAGMLQTNLQTGLTSNQAEAKLQTYGPNALEEEPRSPLYIVFLLQFYNLIIAMLLFAALASMAFQEWVEGIAILFIVTLNATIATVQENSANNALEALSQLSSPQSVVVRDGAQQVVDSKALVPGDVVLLVTGDVVPADIRLVHSVDLKSNEMLLTGESEDVSKKFNAPPPGAGKAAKLTADNMVFASTTITAGNARGVVVETGMSTRVGSIAALLKAKSGGERANNGADAGGNGSNKRSWLRNPLAECIARHKPKQTPLQRALHKLGYIMGVIALGVSILVFVIGLARGYIDPKHPERPGWLTMIMFAVSVAVSAVPEGLPMEYAITGKGFNPEGGIYLDGVNQAPPGSGNVQVRSTLLASVLCSNTHLKQKEVDGVMSWVPFGNSSEAPLVVAAAKAGIWEDYVADEYPRVVEVPFSSSRKMMITLNQLPPTAKLGALQLEPKAKYVACVKGAPNYILANCTRYCRTDGVMVPLTDPQRQQVLRAVDDLSSQALRVLAVAINPLTEIPYAFDCDDADEKFERLSHPLVLLGLVASIDPERDGVREAIASARMASVRTVMITGDYLQTAVAIAKKIDLLQVGADENEEATDCSALRPRGDVYLPEPDVDAITSRTLVFARAKPEDKIEIVNIVAAVERGRVIYANIQKFVMFLLSTNVGEIILIVSSVALGLPMPLEPLQILLLNLFSDGMPAVALSLEKGDPKIMEDMPRPKSQPLIHGRLWLIVACNALILAVGAMGTALLGLYWNFGLFFQDDILAAGGGAQGTDLTNVTCHRWNGMGAGWQLRGNCNARADDAFVFGAFAGSTSVVDTAAVYCDPHVGFECVSEGLARAQTMTFVSLAFTEVLRAYTLRSFTEPMFSRMFANKYMQFAGGLSLALTLLTTHVPVVMDDIFGFAYLSWFQWLVLVGVALNTTFWGELLKTVLRHRDLEQQRWRAMREGFDAVLLEVRTVRHHVEKLEK
ncbi:hypothetical protein PybrP1_003897 [[Pythium] brassicae (nom. inval.)]|nr:hypothetical protein PybrP1_003897 [[Pythium] brassicae (nom. inval.)]